MASQIVGFSLAVLSTAKEKYYFFAISASRAKRAVNFQPPLYRAKLEPTT
jgi:hypothetical protein